MRIAIYCVVIFLSLRFGATQSQTSDDIDQEMCFPFRQTPVVRPPPTNQQGRPGKIGPPGSQGPGGPRGDPGECGCDPSEVEQLNATIRTLQASLRQVTDELSTVKNFLEVTDPERFCYVGLKDGRVQDGDITASSVASSRYIPSHGRLDFTGTEPCWAAGTNAVGEWLQVDLKTAIKVIGVITKGRPNRDQWITSFKVAYGNSTASVTNIQDGNGNDQIFQGNSDRNTHVTNRFPHPIWARYFRVVVQTWHGYVSLRMEFITC